MGDGQPPAEYSLAGYIEEFGVEAVMGRRVLGAGEIKRMRYARGLVAAYRGRERAETVAEWDKRNPYWINELSEAMRLLYE